MPHDRTPGQSAPMAAAFSALRAAAIVIALLAPSVASADSRGAAMATTVSGWDGGFLRVSEDALEDLESDAQDGRSELERFADDVIEPQVRQNIQRFLDLVEPWFNRLAANLEDLPQYEAPVILPNGDILIRRKPDAPAAPEDPSEDGEVLDL